MARSFRASFNRGSAPLGSTAPSGAAAEKIGMTKKGVVKVNASMRALPQASHRGAVAESELETRTRCAHLS